MNLWKDKDAGEPLEPAHMGMSVRAGGHHGILGGRRVRNVHWRVADVSAEMLVEVRDTALIAHESRGVAAPLTVRVDGSGPDWLVSLCDYAFIMGLKSPADSPLPDPQRPEGQMRQHGFLPIGIAHDAELDAEAVYVLVRQREPPMAAPPYLLHNVWNRLMSVLGEHLDKHLHVVLLGTGGRVVERAVDLFYYQIDPQTAATTETSAADEPLSVDVQPDDPRQIAQARFWLRDAINRRTSDIHLEPGDGGGRLRFRIDGELIKIQDRIPSGDLVQMITWIKAQARMDIAERRKPLDGAVRLSFNQGNEHHLVDVRISTIPTVHGQKMVLRLLDPETLRSLAAEGLHKTICDETMHGRFTEALGSRDGIVLVTGPTGSGKTTTLNAALFHLLRTFGDRRNMVTIEDPVEYNVPGVNQTQVNEQAGVTFARALRAFLRQDPDIVLVGEIRDPDTASVAIQAALTGHLILATLHTNDALGAVERLQDLGGSPFVIASTVRLFQAQRLLRTLCPNCGTRKPLATAELERKVLAGRLAGFLPRLMEPGVTVFEPTGCPRCDATGFSGRVAVMEMAPVSSALVAAIERNAPLVELVDTARRSGYRPMVENGIDLLCDGRTALGEVEAISLNVLAAEAE